jgi:dTDP-4-amino-4,6-dideoxygalactose transaminase
MTFAASANLVVYTGAEPVFVDSCTDGNLDPELLMTAIDTLRAEGTRVVAAMSVDLFGRCADYDKIVPGLAERGIPLLEDAAEAMGATYHGNQAGSFGAAAAFSFNGNKIMTTSGGGMLVSNHGSLIARARYLSTQARQPAAHYEHTEIGYNYRLSNISAALARAQLSRLDGMLARRRAIRGMYIAKLGDLPGVGFLGRDQHDAKGRGDDEDNCWLTCIVLDPHVAGMGPSQLMASSRMRTSSRGLCGNPCICSPYSPPVAALSTVSQRSYSKMGWPCPAVRPCMKITSNASSRFSTARWVPVNE